MSLPKFLISSTDLLDILSIRFDNEERKDLCFVLDIDYELVTTNDIVNPREIILFCKRRQMLDKLVSEIEKKRPDINPTNYDLIENVVERDFIDRTSEIQLYQDLQITKSSYKAILIMGNGGVGKSFLLRYYELITLPENIFIPIDLRLTKMGIIYIINSSCDFIGWNRFNNLNHLISSFDVNEDRLNNLSTFLSTSNEDERSNRLNMLSEAFFDDISSLNKIVILALDTFESVVESFELRNWIEKKLLPKSRLISNIRLIISGRELPSPSIEWENHCRRLEIGNIPLDYWFGFAKKHMLVVSPETIKACYIISNGSSLEMATNLKLLSEKRSLLYE